MITEEFNYIAHGPLNEGPARKLVILFHGYGVNAGFMEKMAKRVLKEIPDALVICPDAPVQMELPPEEDMAELVVPLPEEALRPPKGLDPDRQLIWFAISDSPREVHDSALAMAEKVNGFIDKKRDELGLDDQDIALMGFSQGGAMALYAACTRGREVACAVAHSALVMDTSDFNAKPPTLLIYGEKDGTFSQEEYEMRGVRPLKEYLPEFEVKTFGRLKHSTNARSRAAAARYIGEKLNTPSF